MTGPVCPYLQIVPIHQIAILHLVLHFTTLHNCKEDMKSAVDCSQIGSISQWGHGHFARRREADQLPAGLHQGIVAI